MSPLTIFLVSTIGTVYGKLICSCGSADTQAGKCLKDSRVAMLKMILGDLLGDLLGEKEGKRDMKIGSKSKRKSSLTLAKGRIKLIGQYQALRDVGALMRGTRNLNICVG